MQQLAGRGPRSPSLSSPIGLVFVFACECNDGYANVFLLFVSALMVLQVMLSVMGGCKSIIAWYYPRLYAYVLTSHARFYI
ncbi:hypothetical protein QQP08_022388 [Theobroma cacao]|nr:hypothetical protein QQP08_022388 [Theobroma cacao]